MVERLRIDELAFRLDVDRGVVLAALIKHGMPLTRLRGKVEAYGASPPELGNQPLDLSVLVDRIRGVSRANKSCDWLTLADELELLALDARTSVGILRAGTGTNSVAAGA